MEENNRNGSPGNSPGENREESNAARRIRLLGESPSTEPEVPTEPVSRWENFWYHNKVKVIIIAAFAFILLIGVIQFAGRNNPDVSLIYAGTDYITPNQNQAFCDILEGMMEDYNGDGKKYAQLNDMVFLTEEQADRAKETAKENGDDFAIDMLANKQMSDRFATEIFGAESSICILSEGQYQMVRQEGGFMKLEDLFDEVPEGAIDEYGIRFSETRLCRFYDAAKIFPDDAVLALRKLSTMSVFTGKSKAERKHANNRELFCRIVQYDFPEGYTEPVA